MNVFVHKVHQVGVVSLHWADTQKSYFLWPAEGAIAERKRGCPGGHDWVMSWDLEKISLLAEIRKEGGISRQRGATFL